MIAIAISYALIGLVMGGGLIADRWDRIMRAHFYRIEFLSHVIVLVIVMAIWPTLFTENNMGGDDHG